MSFKIGEKVVCVDANWAVSCKVVWNYPKLNGTYTVEFVMHDGALTLEEISNSHVDRLLHERSINDLAAFHPWHFRKLTEIPQQSELEETEKEEWVTQFCDCGKPSIFDGVCPECWELVFKNRSHDRRKRI